MTGEGRPAVGGGVCSREMCEFVFACVYGCVFEKERIGMFEKPGPWTFLIKCIHLGPNLLLSFQTPPNSLCVHL